jgi:hypothetical protein
MTSLHIDHWQGQSNQGEEIADASEKELAAAIDRLDDWNHTSVSLKDEAGRVLMIGGGPDRFFIQYLLPEDTGAWVAVGDADAEGEEVLTLGQQEADYPSATSSRRWSRSTPAVRSCATADGHRLSFGSGRSDEAAVPSCLPAGSIRADFFHASILGRAARPL